MRFQENDDRLAVVEYEEWLDELEAAWIEETERLRRQFEAQAEQAGETVPVARQLGDTLEEEAA